MHICVSLQCLEGLVSKGPLHATCCMHVDHDTYLIKLLTFLYSHNLQNSNSHAYKPVVYVTYFQLLPVYLY